MAQNSQGMQGEVTAMYCCAATMAEVQLNPWGGH